MRQWAYAYPLPLTEEPLTRAAEIEKGRPHTRGAGFTLVAAGAPVMFVHTLRTQLEMFLGVMDELDTARVEAIAVDLPGPGRSTAPAVEYTADYFSDRVAGLLDQLDLDTLATPESLSHDSGFVEQAPRSAVGEERER